VRLLAALFSGVLRLRGCGAQRRSPEAPGCTDVAAATDGKVIDLRADRAVGRREFQSHLLAGGGVAKSQAVLSGVCHQFGKEAGQARAVERLEGQGIRLRGGQTRCR